MWPWLGPYVAGGVAIVCTFGFVDDVTVAHTRRHQYSAYTRRDSISIFSDSAEGSTDSMPPLIWLICSNVCSEGWSTEDLG